MLVPVPVPVRLCLCLCLCACACVRALQRGLELGPQRCGAPWHSVACGGVSAFVQLSQSQLRYRLTPFNTLSKKVCELASTHAHAHTRTYTHAYT